MPEVVDSWRVLVPEATTPIRIALVCDKDARCADWASGLVQWLQDSPDFLLVGRLSGACVPRPARPPILTAERIACRMLKPQLAQTVAYDSLAKLPLLDRMPQAADHPVADIALSLGCCRMDASALGRLAHVEWSLVIDGEAMHRAEGSLMRTLAAGLPSVALTLIARSAQSPQGDSVLTAQYDIKPCATVMADFLHDRANTLLQRALSCQLRGRTLDTGATVTAPPVTGPARKPRSYPGRVLGTAARMLSRKLGDTVARPDDHWALRVGTMSGLDFDLGSLSEIPHSGWLMADPFLFTHEGATYVFYEAQSRRDEPAWIEVGRLDGTTLTPLGTALRLDYHLSFPFVFAHGGDVFMIPETHQTDRIEIWRATRFPFAWELHATALEGQSPADSFLFRQADRWWLFTSLSQSARPMDHSSALYLFAVDGPDMNHVVPHPLNPVVIGSDVARNAGSIISMGGALYRPSQVNLGGIYGYGLNIMRIDRLDAAEYHETLLHRITPADLPGARGVHHITCADDRFIIDVYRDRPRRSG